MIFYYVGSFVIALITVALIVPFIRRWALRIGFIDVPMGVKTHDSPTPLGGGLAIYAGSIFLITVALSAFGFDIPRGAIGIIAGATLATIIGIYDDYYQMNPLPKINGEFIAAIIFLAFIERFPTIISYPAYILVASFWIVGLQNAINFIDNLDGMCGGISLTMAVGFGILFVLKGMPVYAILSFGLAGGALGFLRYNLPRANIFLGDGGSLLFGFALSCLGIVHLNTSQSLAGALTPFLIMAFPIFDLTLVTITRLNKGIKVYIASKDHAWDMVRVLGLTREATVNFILLINLILVASGILLFFIEESPIQTLAIVAFALLLAFIGTQLYKNFLFLRYNIVAILTDLFAVNLSFIAYYYIKYESGLLSFASYVPPGALAVPLAWINMFWIILFSALGLYDVPFERRFSRQLNILFKSIVVAAAIFLFLNYKPGEGFQISLTSIAVFVLILSVVIILLRLIIYMIVSLRLRSAQSRLNAIIVSPGEKSNAKMMNAVSGYYYNVLGHVASDHERSLGNLSDLNKILKNTRTARIILDLDEFDYSDLRDIYKAPYYMETIFLASSTLRNNLMGLKRYATVNEDLDIISLRHRPLFTLIFRRLIDVLIALVLIITYSPYWIVKILLLQLRDAEKPDEFVAVDQRESELIIKRFSKNEKPVRIGNPWTLFAILKGELSFYGVTLDPVDQYKSSKNIISGYWRKFLVKPGIFGPGYDGASAREKFDLDMIYLEKTSLKGDILMMIRQILGISLIKEKSIGHA